MWIFIRDLFPTKQSNQYELAQLYLLFEIDEEICLDCNNKLEHTHKKHTEI